MYNKAKVVRWILLATATAILSCPSARAWAYESPEFMSAQIKLLSAENERLKAALKETKERLAKLEERVARLEAAAAKPAAPAHAAAAKPGPTTMPAAQAPALEVPAPAAPAAQAAKADDKAKDKALADADAVVKALDDHNAEMARIRGADLTDVQRKQAEAAAGDKLRRALDGKTVTLAAKVRNVIHAGPSSPDVAIICFAELALKTSEGNLSVLFYSNLVRPEYNYISPGYDIVPIAATQAEAAAIPKGSPVTIHATVTLKETGCFVTIQKPSRRSGRSTGLPAAIGGMLRITPPDVYINGKAVRLGQK